MQLQQLVQSWFDKWETGDFQNLPLTEDFTHTSPYGVIKGKQAYEQLVAANTDKFLGHKFQLHSQLYDADKACVRYTAIKDGFTLEASEWFFVKDGLIADIISYYNIEGEISDERKLTDPDS